MSMYVRSEQRDGGTGGQGSGGQEDMWVGQWGTGGQVRGDTIHSK